VHGSTGLPFSSVSDNGSQMTPLRAPTSAAFNQDRTELLNNHHRQYIRTLRTDQGGEYIKHLMQALLNEHLTNHVVCAKDEHHSVGAVEHAVNNLRHSARAMMLHGNESKRFWHLAIAHAAYTNNVTSLSCLEQSKTIFELLFSKRIPRMLGGSNKMISL